jgi:hypothetical protein
MKFSFMTNENGKQLVGVIPDELPSDFKQQNAYQW